MQNILERIKHILMQEYEFEVFGVHRMPTGVGGGEGGGGRFSWEWGGGRFLGLAKLLTQDFVCETVPKIV